MLRPTRIKQFLRQIYAFPLIRITPPSSSRNVNLMMIAQHVSYKSQRKSHTRTRRNLKFCRQRAQPKTKQERSKIKTRERNLGPSQKQLTIFHFDDKHRRGKYVSFSIYFMSSNVTFSSHTLRMMIVG